MFCPYKLYEPYKDIWFISKQKNRIICLINEVDLPSKCDNIFCGWIKLSMSWLQQLTYIQLRPFILSSKLCHRNLTFFFLQEFQQSKRVQKVKPQVTFSLVSHCEDAVCATQTIFYSFNLLPQFNYIKKNCLKHLNMHQCFWNAAVSV